MRWSADAKRPHDARANEIKGKKSTNRNSTSEIFELDSEPVGAQIIAAADQHVAVDFFVDNRSIVTKADEARLPWND